LPDNVGARHADSFLLVTTLDRCSDQSRSRTSLQRRNELQVRNERPRERISRLRIALITSREIYSEISCERQTISPQIPAMAPVLSKNRKWKGLHAQ
jgi:hypothetical protein